MTQLFWSGFWFATAYAGCMAALVQGLPPGAQTIYFSWGAVVAGLAALASFNHATLQGQTTASELLKKTEPTG